MSPLNLTEVYHRVLEVEARVLKTNPHAMTDYTFQRLHDIGKAGKPPTDAEMLVTIGGILGVCIRTEYRKEAQDIFNLLTHVGVTR